ncbi:hypothetical protein IT41_18535 [Paracoccus halophilus]|uniref:Uncharacterized protein n=1 Tax=Paracoccus halophilus TaxID=376733 RepID=A0A099EV16_9RHOB|nr:hypothetical protein [Paracoccus halophilus]KGJ02069.1 hypothetical protein IT41_18535 [Paracoccus halophilus]
MQSPEMMKRPAPVSKITLIWPMVWSGVGYCTDAAAQIGAVVDQFDQSCIHDRLDGIQKRFVLTFAQKLLTQLASSELVFLPGEEITGVGKGSGP